jgi:hypothetical protein
MQAPDRYARPRPILPEVALGTALGLVFFAAGSIAFSGCGASSALVQCKLDALDVLPEDPRHATVYDAVDVIQRVRACHDAPADGGVK